ncbi:hypothetical protein [Thalassoglobus polymorphus]|uniref:Uncharacterized protein n=1 Tax=Thalassoglobus polymorphus TaxID=2527994 RepID=A0A517QPY0_9PLAN|nr:hypothetical protein [Thalassoglobus polymorphus]QDT33672.1 hypothetical protein Mal48_29260 [Thalassoglobus polymorphus]
MVEKSQSVMRVVSLVLFTMIFAGAWANDRPREVLAQKEMPKPSASISQEADTGATALAGAVSERTAPEVVVPEHVMPKPVLEDITPSEFGMTMSISVETEGLTIKGKTVQQHIQKLPLGIANGDYLMVDPEGGVGWLRIRGQQKPDDRAITLSTQIGEATVRYMRVSPVDASQPIEKMVPVPLQYAAEESKVIR